MISYRVSVYIIYAYIIMYSHLSRQSLGSYNGALNIRNP